MRLPAVRNITIGALGAAVIGLGAVVAVDHTAGARPASAPAQPAAVTTTSTVPQDGFALLSARSGGPMRILSWLSKEVGVPAMQIIADVRAGETLDQIAGSRAGTLRADVLAYARQKLDEAVTKGGITKAQERRLIADAEDALSVLMDAKLGALFAGH